MPKSTSPQGAKPTLSPLHSFVLYCLATPKDRREAVRELLGDAEASHLFAAMPLDDARGGATAPARSRAG